MCVFIYMHVYECRKERKTWKKGIKRRITRKKKSIKRRKMQKKSIKRRRMETHIYSSVVRRQLDDIHNFVGRRLEPDPARALDLVRHLVLVGLLNSRMVEANHSSVQVEVGVDGRRIPLVVEQPEAGRQEHEDAREVVVELAVAAPELAADVVLGMVAGLGAKHVSQDALEAFARDDGAGKAGVRSALDGLVEERRCFFYAGREGLFGSRQACHDLRCQVS